MTTKPYRLQDMLKQIERVIAKHKTGNVTPDAQMLTPTPTIPK